MFNNPFSMVVAIVLIVTIGRVIRARYGIRTDNKGNELPIHDPESDRLRDEIKVLKDRIQVLERIATDNNRAVELDREIEKLR